MTVVNALTAALLLLVIGLFILIATLAVAVVR